MDPYLRENVNKLLKASSEKSDSLCLQQLPWHISWLCFKNVAGPGIAVLSLQAPYSSTHRDVQSQRGLANLDPGNYSPS